MKKAYFIGISGIGMSAVAVLLKSAGWGVSGSDEAFYPPASTYLEKHRVRLHEGYSEENIPDDTDLIVVGKNAKLLPETNNEVKAAFECGIAIRSFPEILCNFVEQTKNIVVAGSYGKSTCSALLAWCLLHAGKDPGYFIGAKVLTMEETARLGESDLFVLEGDEYPSANWDSTSKFLYYNPRDVLLTSAEHDHVNVFPTHEEYLVPFKTLLSLIPQEGLLVASAKDESARALAHTHVGKKVFYGIDHPEATWSAQNIVYGETSSFDLMRKGEKIVSLTTVLLGRHNIENIVGVAALLLERELLTPEELSTGIAAFRGIERRLDRKPIDSSVLVYEGFGSSYTKARAAIEAMKLHFPQRRLVILFEPHTFSWRNRDALEWYDTVFEGSGLVLLYEPATQGAETHAQLTQEEIVERVAAQGHDVHPIHTPSEALELLDSELKEDDVVLLLTSGSLGGLIEELPSFIEKKFSL